MISVIETEFVKKRNYISDDELLQLITIAESTPGPIAVNSATYVGFKRGGFLGGIFATIGVCLPSFVIIFVLFLFLEKFMQISFVSRAFKGVKSGVGAIIIAAGVNFCKKLNKKFLPVACFIISLGLTIAFDFLPISFSAIWFIVAGSIIGIICEKIKKQPCDEADKSEQKPELNGGLTPEDKLLNDGGKCE